MLASLTGLSSYAYAAIAVGGLAVVGIIVFIIIFRSKQDFARGVETQKAKTANARAEMTEAEIDLMKRQGEIMGRDESREDTAKSLDEGSF